MTSELYCTQSSAELVAELQEEFANGVYICKKMLIGYVVVSGEDIFGV